MSSRARPGPGLDKHFLRPRPPGTTRRAITALAGGCDACHIRPLFNRIQAPQREPVPAAPRALRLSSEPLPGMVRIMHKALFSRFAAASVAVVPLTLVSALVWIDGSLAGQAGGRRDGADAPTIAAHSPTTARPRPDAQRRRADPPLDSLTYGAAALFFGRADAPEPRQAPARGSAAQASQTGAQGDGTRPGHTDDWTAGLAMAAAGAKPYGHDWIAAPQAAWNPGRPGVSSAFTPPAGSSASPSGSPSGNPQGTESPAGGAGIPGSPQVFNSAEDPVAVLMAAARGATPAESTAEPLALLAAPVITARDATARAIPEPPSFGLALGALGLAGIGLRGRRRSGR